MENRLEKKFIYSNGDETFKMFLISGMFKKIFPQRIVNSIYFDTPMFQDVWDNINGFGLRKKIRLRWYNELKKSDVFLEEKSKINFLTRKKTELIGNFNDFNDLQNSIKSKILDKINLILNKKINLNASIFIQYERNYFELPNKKLRITIDRNLKIFLKYPQKFISLDKTILELKFKVKDAEYVRNFVKETKLHNRNQKFSKYVNSFIDLNDSAYI